QEQAEAHRRRHRSRDHQHLPVRHLPASARGDPRRRERVREAIMNFIPKMNRRSFVVGTAATGAGLAIGFDLPAGGPQAALANSVPELGAWVVIKPDDSVVI